MLRIRAIIRRRARPSTRKSPRRSWSRTIAASPGVCLGRRLACARAGCGSHDERPRSRDRLVVGGARAALSRARARHALRIYEGAAVVGASSFKGPNTSANAEIQGALRPLRARAPESSRRNTPYGRAPCPPRRHGRAHGRARASRPCGHRLGQARPPPGDPLGDWERHAEVTGQLGFYGMQALSVRGLDRVGRERLRFIDRPLDDRRRVPLQLQLLESDFIDQWRDGIYGNDGHPGTEGLEHIPASGVGSGVRPPRRSVAQPEPTGRDQHRGHAAGRVDLRAADELIHLFKVLRPGQVRGVSWFAPILMTARDLATSWTR